MSEVKAELSKNGKYVLVTFDYDPDRVLRIKRLPVDSRKFRDSRSTEGKEVGGPCWKVRKDIIIMRRMREQFGEELEIGPKLAAWGHEEVAKERNLKDLSMADDAKLDHIPPKLSKGKGVPIPWRKINGKTLRFKLRPYQRADIKFMSKGCSINANMPGTGKTSEFILAVLEAELEWGQHLVSAPVSSLEDPWEDEIKAMYHICGLDEPLIFTGYNPASRKRAIKEAREAAEEGYAFWLVLNPYMFRGKEKLTKEGKERIARREDIDKGDYVFELHNPELLQVDWDSVVVDEFHLCGLTGDGTKSKSGRKLQFTQFKEGIDRLVERTKPTLRCAMSGTPMGGKPIKLWYALNFLDPDKFPSKWAWARQWLVVEKNEFGSSIEGIIPGREQEFYEHLKPYLIRRTKAEALPGLPPKVPINVWCPMTERQKEQYEVFERDAEWRIGEAEDAGRLSASNILAEYTRLKQFASAFCDVKKTGRLNKDDMPIIEVEQTLDSGKFDMLMEKLAEENVLSKDDPKCAIIASQFTGVVNAIVKKMEAEKVPVAKIDGSVTEAGLRTAIKQAFQTQEPQKTKRGKTVKPMRVIVVQTEAGGTSLTLSRANSVHLLDETWVPDDQEQVEDRAHRGDEMTMSKDRVNCYYYRTKDTVEEDIQQLNIHKDANNKTVLELRQYIHSRQEEAVAA